MNRVIPIVVVRIMSSVLLMGSFFAHAENPQQVQQVQPAISTGQAIPIKVVVVTLFEIGEDTGDKAGEFQNWVERLPLPQSVAFPQGYRQLRYNPETGVLGIVTGIGTARAAASIMALGMDPRFDLSKAYWLVAGIAGVDPQKMSVGSAAWAEWLVDGDLAHEIDPREMPKGWKTGYVPLRRATPYEQPPATDNEGAVYHLNAGLRDWAFQLTKDTKLDDSKELKLMREKYVGYQQGMRPPFVLKGDNLAASTFWHGKLMNDWANDWVSYWTGGKGSFVTSAMEDTGVAQSLTYLSHAGRADINRLMVLRAASNYTMPHKGVTAAQSLSSEKKGSYSAYTPALEAAFRVGSRVVNEIAQHWDIYENKVPSEK